MLVCILWANSSSQVSNSQSQVPVENSEVSLGGTGGLWTNLSMFNNLMRSSKVSCVSCESFHVQVCGSLPELSAVKAMCAGRPGGERTGRQPEAESRRSPSVGGGGSAHQRLSSPNTTFDGPSRHPGTSILVTRSLLWNQCLR